MKRTIRLTENELKQIVLESVESVLNEGVLHNAWNTTKKVLSNWCRKGDAMPSGASRFLRNLGVDDYDNEWDELEKIMKHRHSRQGGYAQSQNNNNTQNNNSQQP